MTLSEFQWQFLNLCSGKSGVHVCYDSVSSGRGLFSVLQVVRTGLMLTEEDLIKNGTELPGCAVSLKIN
jgi:hypothetical protein